MAAPRGSTRPWACFVSTRELKAERPSKTAEEILAGDTTDRWKERIRTLMHCGWKSALTDDGEMVHLKAKGGTAVGGGEDTDLT